MIRSYGAVRRIAGLIAEAAERAMDAYRKERVTDEPHVTDRLMGAIEESVSNQVTSGVLLPFGGGFRMPLRWEAKTLRASSGAAAEEKRHGADILGVLTVELRDFKTSKGFLAQAKRAEPGKPLGRSEWHRLQDQCDKMLAVTPDAFLLVYSKQRGARFISANSVVSYAGDDAFDLYDMSVRTFFEKHLQCFIGDRRLDSPEIATLDRLRAGADDAPATRYVLHLEVREAE